MYELGVFKFNMLIFKQALLRRAHEELPVGRRRLRGVRRRPTHYLPRCRSSSGEAGIGVPTSSSSDWGLGWCRRWLAGTWAKAEETQPAVPPAGARLACSACGWPRPRPPTPWTSRTGLHPNADGWRKILQWQGTRPAAASSVKKLP
jgi:hypothetical protein